VTSKHPIFSIVAMALSESSSFHSELGWKLDAKYLANRLATQISEEAERLLNDIWEGK